MSSENSVMRIRLMIKFGNALFGIALVWIGLKLLSASWGGAGFLAGFLLFTGIQIFFWVIGIRSELLGNVTDDVLDWQGEEETSKPASSAVQQ
ncbi:MAG: hypothetical protein L0Y75_03915 [Acidobacteria bacterium]|nr:hypothetical protein [Acidobacteriota bacterium]